MIEIYPNLFIGSDADLPAVDETWNIVQAAKEPHHRAALGYKTRGAPKDDPEYLYALRGNRLILNMVDADSAVYFPRPIVEQAITYTYNSLLEGKPVLIQCNQGHSRAPMLGMLYLRFMGKLPSDFEKALEEYKRLYPDFEPGKGALEFLRSEWE